MVLVGLPGAGKTTVAAQAAGLLNAPWSDLDDRICARVAKTVEAIFADEGEERFRELERAEMEEQITQAPRVIAAGAGWAACPGNLEAIAGKALVIYLSVDPAEAARRLTGTTDRPLLRGRVTEAALAELLVAREVWYRLADIEMSASNATPDRVAAAVAIAARQYGGW